MEGSEGIQAELAWMAVWNRSLVGKEGESDDGDSAGILCAFSTGTSSSCSSSADRELISRRVGLAQGLVDFTRSFASASAIRSVQSANQQLVFVQPEEGWWISAAFDNQRSSSVRSRESTQSTAATIKGKPAIGHPPAHPRDQAYHELLQRAYYQFRLVNGSLSTILSHEGRLEVERVTYAFFQAWIAQSLRLDGLGTPQSHLKLPEHVRAQLARAEGDGVPCIAVDRSGLLYLSSSPGPHQLTHSDKLAIGHYLLNLLPPRQPAPEVPSTASDDLLSGSIGSPSKNKKDRKQRQASASWKNLGLAGIGSYLANPITSLSLSTSSSGRGSDEPERKDVRDDNADSSEAKRETRSSWGMASLGLPLSALSWKGGRSASTSTVARQQAQSDQAGGAVETEGALRESQEAQKAGQVEKADEPDEATAPIDEDALQEAIEGDMSAEHGREQKGATGDPAAFASEYPTKPEEHPYKVKTKRIFAGEPGVWAQITCISNEDAAVATVAFRATDPSSGTDQTDHGYLAISLHQSIIRWLSQSVPDEIAVSPSKASATLPNDGTKQLYHSLSTETPISIADHVSASTTSLAARGETAISASNDVLLFLSSGTKEIFIRTGLSHWVIARTSAEVGEVKLDVTILPKTVGKEGSLIDADAEIRRLDHLADGI